eukprot:CAMPEP_0170611210 /NCGR_PEP_ID=MMETSP0224-20130122/23069_1 /TAXON_ID=285029 /ORGANISM="Togula jolla, Strain CCCM 725" /LENGTH=398 /DNA_ID=CAMNT_0010936633 /DNA_START=42 /DNA_END=1238 /DNA_ORIENTATION=-
MASEPLVAIRRTVPNDHSCLFYALAYLADGGQDACSKAKARELRQICAEDALNDPDPATRALLLGMNSVQEYADWIKNDMHWGGENEIITLAKHYHLEVAVICCQSTRILCYGSDDPSCRGRGHILYTGQHYDPVVGAADVSAMPNVEQRQFPRGDVSLEASALALARAHMEEAARRASQRRAKRIKCLGCGTVCNDAEAFATHCSEVEHDDDFACDCEETEVVIEGDESLPEGTIDISDVNAVHSFYETEKEPLAMSYDASVEVAGVTYRTMAHYWYCAPFLGRGEDDLVSRIRSAETPVEADIVAHSAGVNAQWPDWRERRGAALREGVLAKFSQHDALRDVLLATGSKQIVCVSPDSWAGMQAPGGLATGANAVGKALVEVREQLRSSAGMPVGA